MTFHDIFPCKLKIYVLMKRFTWVFIIALFLITKYKSKEGLLWVNAQIKDRPLISKTLFSAKEKFTINPYKEFMGTQNLSFK